MAKKSDDFRVVHFEVGRGVNVVHNEQEFLASIQHLFEEPIPKSFNLISPNGDIFTIALGKPFGFVQFEGASPDYQNYFIAVDRTIKNTGSNIREIDAGGTFTPIPTHACIQVNLVLDIVRHYMQELMIPGTVDWEMVKEY